MLVTWLFSILMKLFAMFWIVDLALTDISTSFSLSPFSSAHITPIEAALASLGSVFLTTVIHVMRSLGNAMGNDCDAIRSDVSKTYMDETANSSLRQSANNTFIAPGCNVATAPQRGVNSIPLTSLSDS